MIMFICVKRDKSPQNFRQTTNRATYVTLLYIKLLVNFSIVITSSKFSS